MQAVLTDLQCELGITFVYVTNSQSEAFAMADRVIIMGKGEIGQIGTPKEIYRAPANHKRLMGMSINYVKLDGTGKHLNTAVT